MKEEQLRYILEISRAGSVNKAAENLYISHQSLDRSLKNVETQLGVSIFKRTKRGVEATPLGEAVLEKAQALIDLYDELYEIVHKKDAQAFDRTFTIYSSSYLRYPFVNEVVQKLIEAFPQISFCTKMCPSEVNQFEDGFYLLLTWDIDFLEQLAKDNMRFWRFSKTSMCLVTSAEHKLAKYESVSIFTALRYPFASLQLGSDMLNPFVQWCGQKHIKMDLALETDHIVTYTDALKSGKFVGIWLETALEMDALKNDSRLKVLGIKDLPCLHICGIMLEESYEKNADVVQTLLNFIEQDVK